MQYLATDNLFSFQNSDYMVYYGRFTVKTR